MTSDASSEPYEELASVVPEGHVASKNLDQNVDLK